MHYRGRVPRPVLVLVSGPPGSGKSTLAHRLAAELGLPLLSRDEIKQGMVHTTPDYVPEGADAVAWRTYAAFFDTLALLVRAEVSLVAEAAFGHDLWVRGLGPVLGHADLRVLRCTLDPHLARERSARRLAAAPAARAAHPDRAHLKAAPTFLPLTLDAPTLDVDPTDGYTPGLPAITTFARG